MKNKKETNTIIYRIKPESKKRVENWARFYSTTMAEITQRCLRAYKRLNPILTKVEEGNEYRVKSSFFQMSREKMLGLELNSFELNQIILWWTSNQGTNPPKKEKIKGI